MKKHEWIATILAGALLGLLVMTSGCQTAGAVRDTARDVGERVAESEAKQVIVRIALRNYVIGDIEKAERILNVVGEVRAVVLDEGESVYLSDLRDLVIEEIGWENLSEADRRDADELLSIVVREFRESVSDGLLSAEDRITIAELLDLIESGAEDVTPEATNTLYPNNDSSGAYAYTPRPGGETGGLHAEIGTPIGQAGERMDNFEGSVSG